MDVEIMDENYFPIFPKMPIMNIICFCNQEKINETNKYFELKYFIHKLDIWSSGEKKSFSSLCVFALIMSVLCIPIQVALWCVLTAIVNSRYSKTLLYRTELKAAKNPFLSICCSN